MFPYINLLHDILKDRDPFPLIRMPLLEQLGGSASIPEILEQITTSLTLPNEVLNILHNDGPQSEVHYLAAWARTYLKYVGTIDNPSRGIWTITEYGRKIGTEDEVRERVRREIVGRTKTTKTNREQNAEFEVENEYPTNDEDWQEALLNIVRGIEPGAFERLCQRILRESGFIKVEVTGRSGDGGIDGAGVLRVKLISFHVRFQCKRYTGSVSAREIRDFRGAMVGRADKGLFITTGRFTSGAEREAVRDGAPAIDLIDGTTLCNLLKDYKLGVEVETVEVVKPKPEFFRSL